MDAGEGPPALCLPSQWYLYENAVGVRRVEDLLARHETQRYRVMLTRSWEAGGDVTAEVTFGSQVFKCCERLQQEPTVVAVAVVAVVVHDGLYARWDLWTPLDTMVRKKPTAHVKQRTHCHRLLASTYSPTFTNIHPEPPEENFPYSTLIALTVTWY